MQATKEQKQLIAINTPSKDIKEEWVQWATGDTQKRSTNDLSFDEANKILEMLKLKPHVPDNWAVFDKDNKKHRNILSLMYQAGWTIIKDGKEVPDMQRLDAFLKSKKCPIAKPLMQFDDLTEMPKLIQCFKGIVKSKYK